MHLLKSKGTQVQISKGITPVYVLGFKIQIVNK